MIASAMCPTIVQRGFGSRSGVVFGGGVCWVVGVVVGEWDIPCMLSVVVVVVGIRAVIVVVVGVVVGVGVVCWSVSILLLVLLLFMQLCCLPPLPTLANIIVCICNIICCICWSWFWSWWIVVSCATLR